MKRAGVVELRGQVLLGGFGRVEVKKLGAASMGSSRKSLLLWER